MKAIQKVIPRLRAIIAASAKNIMIVSFRIFTFFILLNSLGFSAEFASADADADADDDVDLKTSRALVIADLSEKFSKIYMTNAWNGGSGPGSFFRNTGEYRNELQKFFNQEDITSIVDVGCGDWQYMQHMAIPSTKTYTGYDVVLSVIQDNIERFQTANIHFCDYDGDFEQLIPGDLCVIKDVLQHLSNANIAIFIEQLKKGNFKYALITNFYKSDDLFYADKLNSDIENGGWRPLDLTLAPFNLSMNLVLDYQGGGHKRTYLWTAAK